MKVHYIYRARKKEGYEEAVQTHYGMAIEECKAQDKKKV
jgi:hypothetical protein